MLVLNLACALDHRFEGWFGSADDFESQLARGLVACPSCGLTSIERRPSAPRLNVAHPRGESAESANALPIEMKQQMQQALREIAREVIARTEDVGERFPDEARRIHYGEAEQRGIRGKATPADAAALADEGIAVMALPVEPTLQ
ncbi:DUF1178 family protein [Paucibacter sp. R3-3]|uniref:DUF1178 family protein n=1 Tax=Roseateles agri TaxID=3098619 RepID=A0ABU5DQE8_9BURK|nr:DUF1178 family protein [Paucibacter sp. R3-3]MDY0747494.1 DUF1178 family protein [Paucibacter sp. R3-3]